MNCWIRSMNTIVAKVLVTLTNCPPSPRCHQGAIGRTGAQIPHFKVTSSLPRDWTTREG